MPLGRPVVVLGEGMGSYWRDLEGGGVFCVRVVCWGYGLFLGYGLFWEGRGTYRSQYCV